MARATSLPGCGGDRDVPATSLADNATNPAPSSAKREGAEAHRQGMMPDEEGDEATVLPLEESAGVTTDWPLGPRHLILRPGSLAGQRS